MEAVAVLHRRGYGRLKLYCYVKEGLGAWRHWVIASDAFPDNIWAWDGPKCQGSLPGMSPFQGQSAEEVAESVLARCPALVEAARGKDEIYVAWFDELLAAHPDGILEMESPLRASIVGDGEVSVPELKAWTSSPPTPMSTDQIAAAQEAAQRQVAERARQQHLKRRRSK